MKIVNAMLIKAYNRYVGSDKFGNFYYESETDTDFVGRKKRYIINKSADYVNSVIDPLWHSWLVHLISNPPFQQKESAKISDWVIDREANFTGTSKAHVSKLTNNDTYESFNPF